MSKKEEKKFIERIKWEKEHHETFNYKKTENICNDCGERNGLHTYTCVYYDNDKDINGQ